MTQKVPKKRHDEKVDAIHLEEAPEEAPAAATLPAEEPPLTDEERAEAAPLVPQPTTPPQVELREAIRYRVTAGGRAWCQGQLIRFQTGEEFTSETWEERFIAGFRECGVTIEQIK